MKQKYSIRMLQLSLLVGFILGVAIMSMALYSTNNTLEKEKNKDKRIYVCMKWDSCLAGAWGCDDYFIPEDRRIHLEDRFVNEHIDEYIDEYNNK